MAFSILGQTTDHRTHANVVYCKCSIKEYMDIVGDDFENFSIQRKRESHRAYKRLKSDLKEGALLPSITLALKHHLVDSAKSLLARPEEFKEFLQRKNQADILDGLQRTYLIHDLIREGHDFPENQEVLLEFWIEGEISRLIYRMIVLNAGQKPMSVRHQIELLFISLKETIEERIDDIEIFVEKDAVRRTQPKKYSLGVIASAYQAFLTRSPEIDKNDVISGALVQDTILDSSEEEHTAKFSDFIDYFKKIKKIDELAWTHYDTVFNEERFNQLNENTDISEEEKIELNELILLKNSRSWLGSENVMLGLYSAISQFENTNRRVRVERALDAISEKINNGERDPFGLIRYEKFRNEINPKRTNVGNATRKLILNGFKEFFRDEGETPFCNCWEQASD